MRIRLYLDEDAMARALVQGLRARGTEVTTVLEERTQGHADASQLEHATRQGRVLYTFNVGDFCRLHAEYIDQGRSHAGIIVAHRQRQSVGQQIRRLSQLVDGTSAEEMGDRLCFL